jgi:PEP-CTERM motif
MNLKTISSLCCGLVMTATGVAQGAIIVNDRWRDGTRTDPIQPVYSENGLDVDLDGDVESLWYSSPGAALTPSPGNLLMTQQTGSSSYTTYFTTEATPVTLGQGDKLRVTWVFVPNGLGTDAGRGLRMALVNTGALERRTSDGSPIDSMYTGYRVSLNVSSAGLPASAIEIRERATPATTGNLLVNDSQWTAALASAGGLGNTSMVNGTQYTYEMTLTRTVADEIIVDASVTGGTLNNTGVLSTSFTDATANGGSFTFDTFALRPNSAAATAATFDAALFRVEYLPIPEPATLALAGLGMLAAAAVRRK